MNNNNDFTYDTDKFKGLPDFLHEIAEVNCARDNVVM